jgi:hypothetical protein
MKILGFIVGLGTSLKRLGRRGGIWRLIKYCIFGMARGVLYNRRLFGTISAYRI